MFPEEATETGKSRWLRKLWMAGSFTSLALIKYDIPEDKISMMSKLGLILRSWLLNSIFPIDLQVIY